MAINLITGAQVEVRDADLDDVEDGDAETVYTVQQLVPSESRRITKSHTKWVPNKRTGQRDEIIDHRALVEDLLDAALVGWKGVLVGDKPAPCTRENKLLLDGNRRTAILKVAGMNRISAEGRDASFRESA